MGDIENRLGTTITMNNNAAIDERRSKWKFADFGVCCCIFIFIIVLFVAALVSDIKNRRLVFDTESVVTFIIIVVIFALVIERRDLRLHFFKKVSYAHPVDHILLSYNNCLMHMTCEFFLSETSGPLQSMGSICCKRDDTYNMWISSENFIPKK